MTFQEQQEPPGSVGSFDTDGRTSPAVISSHCVWSSWDSSFPESHELAELRQQALQRLRALHQQLNVFKLIVYSEWAQSELAPVD
jgi:hypothetical protein